MVIYLRAVTRPTLLVILLAALACRGSGAGGVTPVAQAPADALTQFMAAVKAKDLRRMGQLWGTERGPAASYMPRERLDRTLQIIQVYLAHTGYRVLDGHAVSDRPPQHQFRIELQRDRCTVVMPIDLVRSRGGGGLVLDVHLEAAGNPAGAC